MKIEPGFYKVTKGEKFSKEAHFLRVWVEKGIKYIQIDASLPQALSNDDENWFVQDYRIEKKYTKLNPIKVTKAKVIFEFEEEGTIHRMVARNWYVVMRILEQFPRLKKALDVHA